MALKALRDVRGERSGRRSIALCGQPGAVERVHDVLVAGDGADLDAAVLVAIRRLERGDVRSLQSAAVVGYGGWAGDGLDAATRGDLGVVSSAGRPAVVVLEGSDARDAANLAGRIDGIVQADVIAVRAGVSPVAAVLRRVAERLGADGPPLAARLPALRPFVVGRLIARAARRNGAAAAAIWVPGADMPVLTAVELQLVLRIAACYGEEPSPDRLLELASVFGAGIGFRAVAREALDLVPLAGWAVKGAVAYSGTRAIGVAAREYFER
ncbi:MAG TPA: DUF697 domain-containing protein, partial [Gaiellales bacterium]|nr:DUF697 domain-containing protein [Gaiellales bacterium]